MKFEDLFIDTNIAPKVSEQLLRMECLKKDGSWKGISGNKMEIVAVLDALENLDVFKQKKHTVLAKTFCEQFNIIVDKDIPMGKFYHTPPINDYHRFRKAFKEMLETEKVQMQKLEKQKQSTNITREKAQVEDYIIVSSEDDELILQNKVLDYLKMGYEPIGGLTSNEKHLYQAMVRYK